MVSFVGMRRSTVGKVYWIRRIQSDGLVIRLNGCIVIFIRHLRIARLLELFCLRFIVC